jgi:hypothetical protein
LKGKIPYPSTYVEQPTFVVPLAVSLPIVTFPLAIVSAARIAPVLMSLVAALSLVSLAVMIVVLPTLVVITWNEK